MKGNTLAIYKESRHPREAYEFIKFVTSAKSEMFICGRLRRWITTHKSVARDPRYLIAYTPPSHTDVFLHEMEYGHRIPINERYNQWSVELSTGLGRMWTNELDAKEAVKWMVPRINRALQEKDW
jgi:ABC-type glycerol-3-phosphate transport system substrate-binding protein